MFVVLQFTDHSAVLVTGLGRKSRLLHFTGTSFPSKKMLFSGPESPSSLTKTLERQVLIPSIEDYNLVGVSEQTALDYWRYVKASMYSLKGGEIKSRGRTAVINTFYDNTGFFGGFNCATFASNLLFASLPPGIRATPNFWPSPGRTTAFAIAVRDEILEKIYAGRTRTNYGLRLENLHIQGGNTWYEPNDNLGCQLAPKYQDAGSWTRVHSGAAFDDLRVSDDELLAELRPIALAALLKKHEGTLSDETRNKVATTLDMGYITANCGERATNEARIRLAQAKKREVFAATKNKEAERDKSVKPTPYSKVAALAAKYQHFERLTPRDVRCPVPAAGQSNAPGVPQ